MKATLERVATILGIVLGTLVAVLIGAVMLGVGLWGAIYQLQHPAPPPNGVNAKLVGMFIGLAILGALIMPSIFTGLFPRVQKIFVLVFPNGVALPWGRRATDQPPTQPPGAPPIPPPSQP